MNYWGGVVGLTKCIAKAT